MPLPPGACILTDQFGVLPDRPINPSVLKAKNGDGATVTFTGLCYREWMEGKLFAELIGRGWKKEDACKSAFDYTLYLMTQQRDRWTAEEAARQLLKSQEK